MPTFRIGTRPKFARRALEFHEGDMGLIGDTVVDSIKARLDRGEDRFDRAMPPLTEAYAKTKQRRGRRPVRDLRLSGSLRTATDVNELSSNRAKVNIRGATLNARGFINQAISPWFGLSPRNGREADEVITKIFEQKFNDLLPGRGGKRGKR